MQSGNCQNTIGIIHRISGLPPAARASAPDNGRQREPVRGASFLLTFRAAAEAVFDVVVQDKIQLLRREPVVPRQHRIDFVGDGAGGGLSSHQLDFQRLRFPVLAHAEDAAADDVALRVHTFHDGVVGGFLLVSGRVREADFEKVRLGVEPYFYFVGHSSSPGLGNKRGRGSFFSS